MLATTGGPPSGPEREQDFEDDDDFENVEDFDKLATCSTSDLQNQRSDTPATCKTNAWIRQRLAKSTLGYTSDLQNQRLDTPATCDTSDLQNQRLDTPATCKTSDFETSDLRDQQPFTPGLLPESRIHSNSFSTETVLEQQNDTEIQPDNRKEPFESLSGSESESNFEDYYEDPGNSSSQEK